MISFLLTAAARVRARRHTAALLGLLVTLVVLAGCTGSSSSGNGDQAAANRAAAPAPKAQSGGGQSAEGKVASSSLQQRDIVRTATVKLRARDVDRAADTIVGLAEPAGGRVDGDDRASHDKTREATLVLRVPPESLNRIISRIDELGNETSRSVHGEDVTARKADVTARTASLQTSVDRLRSLMSHSGNINSLVSLESQLTQRESELESMQAQQRALRDKIGLATLTVELSSKPKPAPAKPHSEAAGLGDAFVSGWHALTVSVRWLIKIFGYSLPITAVLVLIGAAVTVGWRRRHRTVAEPTTE